VLLNGLLALLCVCHPLCVTLVQFLSSDIVADFFSDFLKNSGATVWSQKQAGLPRRSRREHALRETNITSYTHAQYAVAIFQEFVEIRVDDRKIWVDFSKIIVATAK